MNSILSSSSPGPLFLFGSGETSPSGRKAFEVAFRGLPASPQVALLETPAGFELNSPRVVGRIASFLHERLQNYHPHTTIIPARKRGNYYSPDNPEIVQPLYQADLVFLGPGSPTYAVRQLRDSLAWSIILARQRMGATLALASAATIAISAHALPVYEIYKVGEELHWAPGLDFFGAYGMPLVFIPHWNNNDGGEELDTSRCFMGQTRFARLMEMLPPELTVIGLDDKTVLAIYPGDGECRVIGQGCVTLLHTGHQHKSTQFALVSQNLENQGLVELAEARAAHVHQYFHGQTFPLRECGVYHVPQGGKDLPPQVWEQALEARRQLEKQPQSESEVPPLEVTTWVEKRQAARASKDWAAADELRQRIAGLGWQVVDTPEGPRVKKRLALKPTLENNIPIIKSILRRM